MNFSAGASSRSLLFLFLIPSIVGCPNGRGGGEPLPDVLIEAGEAYEGIDIAVFPGVVGVPNIDDDNEDGVPDWHADGEGDLEEENDLVEFFVRTPSGELQDGEQIRLSVGGDAGEIRVYDGATVILGELPGPNPLTFDYGNERSESEPFHVEFYEWPARASVTATRYDADGEEVGRSRVPLTPAPMILNHHLQQTDKTWVVAVNFGGGGNNNQMVSKYESVLGDAFDDVFGGSYQSDVWIQDEFQFGTLTAPGHRVDLVVDSIRDRGLDDWAEDTVEAPDFVVGVWGAGEQPGSMDSFGNLEVSPPVTVDGVEYPFGRIYYGEGYSQGRGVVEDLRDYLDAQTVQKPFDVDTGWLCVGHIDEYTSFVPDPTAPKGFRFVYADTQAAWDVIDNLDDNFALGQYGRPPPSNGHGLATAGAMKNSAALRAHNEDIQEDVLDPVLDRFKEKLGLDEEDIVYMPSLFEEVTNCGNAALIPGMANLIVANVEEETHVFLADPFFRSGTSSDSGQDDDPMIAAVEEMMPAHIEFHFVDDWDVYHMGLGEVHCGTNMTRTPRDDWWATAGHLLDDSDQDEESDR
jgi:protein-arginine deiminase